MCVCVCSSEHQQFQRKRTQQCESGSIDKLKPAFVAALPRAFSLSPCLSCEWLARSSTFFEYKIPIQLESSQAKIDISCRKRRHFEFGIQHRGTAEEATPDLHAGTCFEGATRSLRSGSAHHEASRHHRSNFLNSISMHEKGHE